MKTEKDKDLAAAKRLLRSLEFIIENPVMETKEEVRALNRIRTRLRKAIANLLR